VGDTALGGQFDRAAGAMTGANAMGWSTR
jgi:hypothetical protein